MSEQADPAADPQTSTPEGELPAEPTPDEENERVAEEGEGEAGASEAEPEE